WPTWSRCLIPIVLCCASAPTVISPLSLHDALLIFQLTEGDAVNHLKQAAAFGRDLRKLGCGLSISRFGGSLDPFKLLEHLPASIDRKSTRLNSSHVKISYAVFCLKKKRIISYTLYT